MVGSVERIVHCICLPAQYQETAIQTKKYCKLIIHDDVKKNNETFNFWVHWFCLHWILFLSMDSSALNSTASKLSPQHRQSNKWIRLSLLPFWFREFVTPQLAIDRFVFVCMKIVINYLFGGNESKKSCWTRALQYNLVCNATTTMFVSLLMGFVFVVVVDVVIAEFFPIHFSLLLLLQLTSDFGLTCSRDMWKSFRSKWLR